MISCDLPQTAGYEAYGLHVRSGPASMHFLAAVWTIQALLHKLDTAFDNQLLTLAPAANRTVQDYCKLTNTSFRQVFLFTVLWAALLNAWHQLFAHKWQQLPQAAELLEGGNIWWRHGKAWSEWETAGDSGQAADQE